MEVRERIIVESGALFGKYGIRSMTMDALAEEMGISKRTIYERFKDKDTLLGEVIKYYKHQTKEDALRTIDESDNVIEALFRIMKLTVSQMSQTNPLFFHDFKKYHRTVYKEFAHPGDIRDYSITQKLFETWDGTGHIQGRPAHGYCEPGPSCPVRSIRSRQRLGGSRL